MMQQMPEMGEDQDQGAAPGGASTLISGIQSDMKKLGSLLEKAGVGGLQEYDAIIQQFEGFIEKLASGQPSAEPKVSGAGTVEAGGNPNARPM